MGPPVSPRAVNLYMEEFKNKALRTAENPPRLWHRYLYDNFGIQGIDHMEKFLHYINSMDKSIKFTMEDIR